MTSVTRRTRVGGRQASRARIVSSDVRTAPRTRAWTSPLPRAVAASGPAGASNAAASAVSLHKRAAYDPSPTMWITTTAAPASAVPRRTVAASAEASEPILQRGLGGRPPRSPAAGGGDRGDPVGHLIRRRGAKVWLAGPRPMQMVGSVYNPERPDHVRAPVRLSREYDLVVYIDRSSPSRLLP